MNKDNDEKWLKSKKNKYINCFFLHTPKDLERFLNIMICNSSDIFDRIFIFNYNGQYFKFKYNPIVEERVGFYIEYIFEKSYKYDSSNAVFRISNKDYSNDEIFKHMLRYILSLKYFVKLFYE